ncbi:pilus (MSHA type) biogenesis protein MshL [Desulfosediminicola ganghwensis]|uniref:pilus (MSHA type) biogenesis protein MshL n=1 Tax=Desulfosediminicola ganghwensis TaxID=2569540 RepID=UPI0010ACE109|nr:pilus (MSHA type) biogenesis protein MshL [Desulfosediminicola ganghwensis]
MMSIKNIFLAGSLVLLLTSLNACKHSPDGADATPAPAPAAEQSAIVEEPLAQPRVLAQAPEGPLTLPVRYQTPSYMLDMEGKDTLEEEEITSIKVGASIRSTRGPQPLWDILKRLAALKGMNVSWASDVDQKVLVDVDISANDDFYDSIDNLLRQVDYFHEVQGNTVVVKYKETRRYHIAMPFTNQRYSTGTGGNVLGGDSSGTDIDGTISLKSSDNEFDIWKNVQDNMDAIINTWNTRAFTQATAPPAATDNSNTTDQETDSDGQLATRQISSGGSMYIIDKPIGVVTVSAPRPLLERLDAYFVTLKKELYKQITIEAKIVEVQLNDSSSIGINWSSVLKDFPVSGMVNFGDPVTGQIYPSAGSDFISSITLKSAEFGVFLNALKEQGNTQILSNPKISVMNGQPALITVGRNVTYIDRVEADRDIENGITTYSAETERILSGIGMALTATILDDDEIIMNLVPVTSELEEPITYQPIGPDGAEVGLPIVNVREMSTTVRVKNGDMLVIGGLISNVDDTQDAFAPVVGDIPVIKYLFGYKEKIKTKRELIILLRPVII